MSAIKPSLFYIAFARLRSHYPSVVLTRQGVMYLVVNLILLLTAINYSNHNILLVALFLLSLFAVSLLLAIHRFQGMEITLGDVSPVFLGQEIQLPLVFKRIHLSEPFPITVKVQLESGKSLIQEASMPEAEPNNLLVHLTLGKRGRYVINKVLISTAFPFGLFRIQQFQAMHRVLWVYPKPLDDVSNGAEDNHGKNQHGDDSDDGIILRPYRLGDPVRRIHKKSLAMGQSILVKDREGHISGSQWFLWDRLQNLPIEQRLQTLTRQVLDADRQGRPYGLSIPSGKINPATGEAHKHHCLRVLAEY